MIRQELKAAFPEIKFSVKSESYSMGNSVNIDWIDGPTTDEVSAISSKYQKGHFDGYNDCYNFDNVNETLPQVKFVFNNRSMSEETKAFYEKAVLDLHTVENGRIKGTYDEVSVYIWRFFCNPPRSVLA